MSDISNLIQREIEKYMAGRNSKRYGIVTSFDPKTHRAKVAFQPEGNESGWLPIHSHHMGSGFGIVVGLTPGDGKATGDLVEISYQEGDYESGAITSRVHSDAEPPPEVQAGEILVQHKQGSKVKLANDGSVLVTDKSGATLHLDGSGNLTVTSTTIHLAGNVTING